MLTIGYARLSPLERQADLDAQQRELRQAGCEKVFIDRGGPYAMRVMLDQALALLREGDVFVCCRPDRLCRDAARLLKIEADLTRRGASLVVLSIGGQTLDTRLPGARLQLGMLAGVVRWQRALAREKQAVGIAAAKARGGVYKGRKASINPGMVQEMARMGLRPALIAKRMGIARSSVYRCLPKGYRSNPARRTCPGRASIPRRSRSCCARWGRRRSPRPSAVRGLPSTGCAITRTGDGGEPAGCSPPLEDIRSSVHAEPKSGTPLLDPTAGLGQRVGQWGSKRPCGKRETQPPGSGNVASGGLFVIGPLTTAPPPAQYWCGV